MALVVLSLSSSVYMYVMGSELVQFFLLFLNFYYEE